MEDETRCLGSLLPHTQQNRWVLGAGPLRGTPMAHVHPIYASALKRGAPLLTIGDYMVTVRSDASHRTLPVCRAYSAPPNVIHDSHEVVDGGVHLATLSPGTCIGPIEEFTISIRFVTVLVRSYWMNVWMCRSSASRGTHLAIPVPPAELLRWRLQGWVDRT